MYVLGVLGLVATVMFVRAPESRLWRAVFDAGHAPLFGAVALLLSRLVRGRAHLPQQRIRPYAIAFALTTLAGIGAELFQFFTPRDADALDMVRNVAGALAFLAVAIAFDRRFATIASATRVGLVGLAASLLLVVAFPVLTLATALVQRNAAFPVLCDFSTRWSRKLLTTQDAQLACVAPPRSWTEASRAAQGQLRDSEQGRDATRDEPKPRSSPPECVGRLELRAARYPGLTLRDPASDWSAYDRLCFDVFSEHDSTVALVLRIDDAHAFLRYEDRFNHVLRIHPGMNPVCVPLDAVRAGPRDRALDLTRIQRVVLFANAPPRAFQVYVGVMRLE